MTATAEELAAALIERLRAAGYTIAIAESLTGGLVTAALVAVPGASDVLQGGVVAYATDLKTDLLGVDPEVLRQQGPVDGQVADAMAQGIRRLAKADVGLATTGVAGPDPQGGVPVGTVFIGLAWGDAPAVVREHHFTGDRATIRAQTVSAALHLARHRTP